MRRSSLTARCWLAAASALVCSACSPSDDLFGHSSSSAGGGASTSSSSDGGGGPPGGGGAAGTSSSGQGGEVTSGPGGGGVGGGGVGVGGAGGGPECNVPSDCPDPAGECASAACNGGVCGVAFAPQGLLTVEQDLGDCRATVCDGSGATEIVDDDDDLVDDGNACTVEVCEDGELRHSNADPGTLCGNGGDLRCDDTGQCVGCTFPDECPGADDACRTRTCDDGVCGVEVEGAGTPVDDDDGNCVALECDGAGHAAPVIDDGDVPFDDNDCTRDVCNDGEPDNPPRDEGAACNSGVCDGDGACVGCVDDTDCGDDTECVVFDCNSDNACETLYADPGDFAGDPIPNDCLHDECGSQGAIVGDVPDDAGESCGGGEVCDGSGSCVECSANGDCNSDTCRCQVCVDYAELFFSQYVEGSASNKALEIYNPLDEAVDLADLNCEIGRFQNGSVEPETVALTGTIEPGGTWVLCNTLATFSLLCDQLADDAMDFNGDDAITLSCDGAYYDAIGKIGEDPGTQWGTGMTSTADNTLTRRAGIVHGASPFDPFVPANEWIGSAQDDIVGLGSHDPCE